MNTHGPGQLEIALEQLVERAVRRALESHHEQRPSADAPTPWMGISKAADYLDWPRQRLYKLTASGAIPNYKHEGRLLFHRAELDQWLAQHAQPVSGLAISPEESYPSTRRATTRRSPE
jgi:excisionase family DNA binding protein